VFTLWFERDAAIEKSEERIVSIAKQLTLHQKNMVDTKAKNNHTKYRVVLNNR